ncbi:Uma2 family endonuclease [Limnothrix redekei]|uniref:Uma2 family endonuclease n=1 Tax=Limnothrix redekei LRLZ20PSL1 TaxID=3112953 RepID=A0ABW7C8D6_9CYAN
MVALPDHPLLTAEEYLAWEATQTERHEFWDGEPIAISGSPRSHNRIAGNIFAALSAALADRPCEVYISDIKVQAAPGRKYFYPDLVVTCDDRDQDERFVQFPSLIVEVLSPSTESFDRGAKFAAYRRLDTLQTYILVQVDRPDIEVFQRNDRGQWVLSDYGLDDAIDLGAIKLTLSVKTIYRQIVFADPDPSSEAD